jgi:PAS domain S-box-containing protein
MRDTFHERQKEKIRKSKGWKQAKAGVIQKGGLHSKFFVKVKFIGIICDIAECREMKMTVKKTVTRSQEFSDSVIDTVREPLIILDQDLRVVNANRSFYKFFKVVPEETVGQLIYDLGNKQWDIPKLRELLETILPEKTTFDDYEVEHDFATIGKRIMLLNARQIQRASGKERIILLAIEDITERKQLEELLADAEERYRRLFETASDGIVLLEKREGKITHANPATEKMLGYDKKESIGHKLQDIGIALDKGDFQTTMQNLNKIGILNYDDVPITTKLGQHIDTDIYLVDRARLVQCNIRDITERKKTTELLRESEEKYRWMLDNMADVITIMDMNLRFTYVSPSIMRMRGYTAEEAMAQTFEQVMTPESLQISAEVFEEEMKLEASGTADPDRIRIVESEQYRKDGSIVLMENHLSFMRDEAKKPVGIISVSHDITERKQAEEKLALNFEIQAAMNILLGLSLEGRPINEFLGLTLDLVLSLKWLAIESKGAIFLADKAGETLHLQVQRGLSKELCAMCKTVPYGHCLCGSAAAARSVQFVDHVDERHDIRYEGMSPHGHYCVPILSGDYVLGVIVLYVKEGHIRSPWEEDFLKAVANSLAGTIGRRQAEDALKESENKYRLIADNMTDLITIMDMNLRFIYISPSITRIRGYTVDEALAQTLKQVMTPESLFLATSVYEEEMRREASGTADPDRVRIIELEEYRKDMSKIWVEVSLSFLRDEHGRPTGILSVNRDITERKRDEKALRKAEETYRLVVDNMVDVITVLDLNLRFTYVSPSIIRLRGYTAEEVMEQTFEQFMTPESLQIVTRVFEEELKLEASGTADLNRTRILELEEYKKDGSTVWLENRMSSFRDKENKLAGIISLSHDITERKKAEETLKESEKKYRLLADNVNDVIFVLDMNLNFTYVSPSTKILRGYEPEESMKLSLTETLAPSSMELAMKTISDIMELEKIKKIKINESRMIPLEMKRKDGTTVWTEVKLSFIRDENQQPVGILGVTRDITQRKLAEAELLRTLESLKKAVGTTIQVLISALEARDPYTAGHQFRVAHLACAIATEMGLSQEKIDGIQMAGSIHDIGKLSIPAEILSKPSKLTNIEFSLIKEHVRSGYEMLKDVQSPWPLAQIVYQHHERMDGSGYPRNLKGDEIIMEARIMAVADVVEAMASHRPYRPSLGIDIAFEEIEKNKGVLYDAPVVDACLKLFREKGYALV